MKTGTVMEGGGMRGTYVAGILDVLLEHGVKTGSLVGVLAGTIRGCSSAAGQAGHSIHYNLKYCRDPRYMSFRSLITTGGLMGNEFCHHELSGRLDPFDNDVFEASPMEFYITCMDVETGRPVYHRCDSLRGKNIQWIRTSASMPLVSRIMETDGHKLLGGGVSDSIPAATFRKMGFGRSLVIPTRSGGYRKRPNHMFPAIRRVYRRHPEFIEIMEYRHLIYSRELKEVKRMEAAGEIFVVRPSHLIETSRTESRPEKIQQVHELGRPDGMKALRDTAGSLGVEPAACG